MLRSMRILLHMAVVVITSAREIQKDPQTMRVAVDSAGEMSMPTKAVRSHKNHIHEVADTAVGKEIGKVAPGKDASHEVKPQHVKLHRANTVTQFSAADPATDEASPAGEAPPAEDSPVLETQPPPVQGEGPAEVEVERSMWIVVPVLVVVILGALVSYRYFDRRSHPYHGPSYGKMNDCWSASEDEGDVGSQSGSSSVSKSETSSDLDAGTRCYTTVDRNGEEHGWEWWNFPKCRKEGLTQTKDEYQLLHMVNNLQRVELPWTQVSLTRVLEDHQCDISKFDKQGSAMKKLAEELQAGEAILMKSSEGLLRVVNVVLVQVVSPDKKVLLEEAMTFSDGRKRVTNRLPGIRQTAEESEYDAALRILKTKLRFPDKTYELDIGTMKQTYVKADDSFPGLRSLKRICHIRCDLDKDNVAMLMRLGLLGSAYECAPRGIKTQVAKYHFKWGDSSEVKFAKDEVPIPRGTVLYPWNEQSVSDLLKQFKIDISKFGNGGAKRLDSLAMELSEGGSHLMQWDGRLVRVVNMVILNLSYGNYHVIETSITTNSGVKRPCKRWPGKIQPESETTLNCIQDILDSKLQIPFEQIVKLSLARETRKLFSHEMSASYPGLPSLYCKQMIQANLGNSDAAMRAKVGLVGFENASSATSFRTATRSAASTLLFAYVTKRLTKNVV
eukprot:gnl/MRDRNA2_/MRDRNA2_33012_c0_seq1.p1 gnl/MRDRNA2_/MRDRNA2_33012_c0~~gnl/MRDRNA2_/MRDRNA2_33012_c0_seq1.p1  ORF type:complete len:672 (-),score=118.64 gnl/MRDRNA2_/MRDRNA2_33012_c0_seq1:70-2085(-)